MPRETYEVPHLSLVTVAERTHALARRTVTCGPEAAEVARQVVGDRPVEHLIAICVDGRGHVTGVITIAQGGMHGAAVRAADVLRAVLACQASAFVLAHNHPSGDPTPSAEDVAVTSAISRAAKIVGVTLLDHVVVTRSGDFACVPIAED